MSCSTGKNRICYSPAMRDLPIGAYFVANNPHHPDKSIRGEQVYVVVEEPGYCHRCNVCAFDRTCSMTGPDVNNFLPECESKGREDGKDVMFKLVE